MSEETENVAALTIATDSATARAIAKMLAPRTADPIHRAAMDALGRVTARCVEVSEGDPARWPESVRMFAAHILAVIRAAEPKEADPFDRLPDVVKFAPGPDLNGDLAELESSEGVAALPEDREP